jgi:phosphate transport system substrate-binding protein
LRRLLICCALVASAATALAAPSHAQTLTLRERLVIVTTGSSASITQLIARSFTERFDGVQPPEVRVVGSTRALRMFCGGVGAETPDIAVSSRQMPRALVDSCHANGVRDIIEVRIGLGAVVLAVKRGEPAPALTSRKVWEGVAAERVQDEEFLPNRVSTWADLGPGLPRSEIRMIVPDRESGTRAMFDDMVLEAGCRDVKQVRLLFEATYRRNKCVALREDGRVREVPSTEVPAALLAAPPGTIGVISYDQLVASGGNLIALRLDGVQPTAATIAALDYEQVQSLYLYAKRQHARNRQGVGVVQGVREFLLEATSETAFGPGGYLAPAGLVPMSPADRAAQRRIADRQTLMSR